MCGNTSRSAVSTPTSANPSRHPGATCAVHVSSSVARNRSVTTLHVERFHPSLVSSSICGNMKRSIRKTQQQTATDVSNSVHIERFEKKSPRNPAHFIQVQQYMCFKRNHTQFLLYFHPRFATTSSTRRSRPQLFSFVRLYPGGAATHTLILAKRLAGGGACAAVRGR